jgi:hypothetical protein
VVTGPAMRLQPGSGQVALDAFVRLYDTWPAERRERADRTLDALTAASADVVASVAETPDVSRPSPTGAELDDLRLRAAALTLVDTVVGPADGHDLVVI